MEVEGWERGHGAPGAEQAWGQRARGGLRAPRAEAFK